MAEALGIAGVSLQLAGLTVKILSTGYSFLSKAKDAPKEIRQLLTETAALDCLLDRLGDLSNSSAHSLTQENALRHLEKIGVFTECRKLLESIDQTLTNLRKEDGERIRNVAKRLVWPLHVQKTVQESLDHLRRMHHTLSTALNTNTALAVNRIETKVNRIDWHRVLSWVCPVTHLQTRDTLQDLLGRRYPGTGLWLVESEEFGSWARDSSEELLWITGLPGVGKTVLSAAIVQAIKTMVSPNGITVYFFCGFEEKEKATLHFLMSVAAQFVSHSERCFDIASKRQQYMKGFPMTVGDYVNLVEFFMAACDQVFIVVDALDEIGGIGNNEKETFIKVLSRLVRGQTEQVIHTKRLRDLDRQKAPIIRDHILRTAGTFLQANLQLDEITGTRSDRGVRRALQSLPNGLNATYGRILDSAVQKYPERVFELKQILQWLTVGLMPLSAENLAEVTSIDPNDTVLDFEEIVTDADEVMAPLGQLVSYSLLWRDHSHPETIVQLHHATVKEFVTGPDILDTSASMFHFSVLDAHEYRKTVGSLTVSSANTPSYTTRL
ncbi:Vegetative incompatibility protein HET-E-1 [Colletotrichum siamense]|nr:Vegetative incompatibility protein HET-E-1 [Colletotrichum siamense]